MQEKGLLEWKILAAIFAVIIVASSVIMTNEGVKGFLFNLTGGMSDWLSGSPFGGVFSAPQKVVSTVSIKLVSDNITLDLDSPVNVTTSSLEIVSFAGVINFDFVKNSTELVPDSGPVIKMGLEGMLIEDVKISRLKYSMMDFVIKSENTSISAIDCIEILDFSGDVKINGHDLLTGNVSKARNGQWSIG